MCIFHVCMVWIEKSWYAGLCSASRGLPCDAEQRYFCPHLTPMIDTFLNARQRRVVFALRRSGRPSVRPLTFRVRSITLIPLKIFS